ncbi:hypothetical protein Q5P01_023858 [Channa striata]|uniref:Uncharacterized protein n=1 Tax=Channa striata TaxID=64152 RepID=A0AA88IV34_CHASR|nr:hypothetical protein Q5P01_023858 [Channa striata]
MTGSNSAIGDRPEAFWRRYEDLRSVAVSALDCNVAPAGEKLFHLFLSWHLKDTHGSRMSASPQPSAPTAIINANIIAICES